ncbi:MAG: 3-methyl-2-oxobutanoate hydroxymethyltransferase [Dehalococcoidia bacterium]|uniref:3-methyl-2-oxobutanoate hydroxymethyltransferase n=1 Tax=Candidatus Amarobacter glycogenicus TaxID=3140699 RepID=UPI003136D9B9|nr:3-methyl-2-oxobutanoate hydroxymethyltransferase [Dehalococcoidia bacterium]MBK7124670.1 3-methyl-2-oxobutanoate hydroxymethyltransferase [Dehalococcoidia bacterium]MBK8561205.1 3-methyl-2-oxobutanoate hydroxymethyltransferase [Dehalococcoidia bacterium]MBK9544257.1 3-methyl-2-oxobutanoate hydroxymethyltransferase [Dehalococcoidia bacterium]
MGRISVHQLKQWKAEGKRFAMITAYDYPSARLVEQAGIPIILVGDSVGSVVLGYESTVPVTMEDILYHTRAVVRATSKAIILADMPFMSYQANADEAVRNAGRLLQEGGATAVKLEGGSHVAPLVRRMVDCGIPVMGHLGLTPQSVNQFGGHKVQGKTPAAAAKLLQDARALEEAGAFAVVLETIPAPLARMVTERITIPTIGIGAGPDCDAQVQVFHDMLGIYDDRRTLKHAKRYAVLGETIREAVRAYIGEVEGGEFPTREHSFEMDEATLSELTPA